MKKTHQQTGTYCPRGFPEALSTSITLLCVFVATAWSQPLLIPIPTPSPYPATSIPRSIRNGVNDKEMPTLSKEKVIPAHAKKASASTPNVEIRGISSDTPVENLRNLKTFSPKELPILSESPAISRQNKSLMAFYALKGDGEMTEVSFSSTLSTPNSADVKRTASIQIPADGKIRMVPLFFSADVTENYPPGEYRMSWSVRDPKTGGYAMVSAFFSKVSKSESSPSSFKKAPFEKSSDSLPRPAPPESNFDKKGVGVIPKSTPSYKFNIPTPSSKKPKK